MEENQSLPGNQYDDYSARRRAGQTAGSEKRKTGLWVCGTIFACFVLLVGSCGLVLAIIVSIQRDRAQTITSANNLKATALALDGYHDIHGEFPATAIKSESGDALLSWRIELLPHMYFGDNYQKIDQTRDWRSQMIGPRGDTPVPRFLRAPADNGPAEHTSYLAVSGTGTCFENDGSVSRGEISDGPENTICIVEALDSGIHWLEPRDLTIDESVKAIQGSQRHWVAVLFADGTVRSISRETPASALRAAFTANGGEPSIVWSQYER